MSEANNEMRKNVRAPVVENGHTFVTGAEVGFGRESILHTSLLCKQCGIVRRVDGKNKECRGAVRITPRAEGNRATIDVHQKNTQHQGGNDE